MHIRSLLVAATIWISPVLYAQGPTTQASTAAPNQKSEPLAQMKSTDSMDAGADYRIGPQDVVRIDVWKEPDISRIIPVRPDGKISLPLLNDIQASGLTALQLGNAIREGLTKYLNSPQVTVTVTEINSRRVYITGEVTRSGALPLLPNMTVLQALSSAGGFTQFAKRKNIYVLRNEGGRQVKYPFNYVEVVKGKNDDQNILLLPGDVIVVP
jgi:polysaccharide biosynthesis/export protein